VYVGVRKMAVGRRQTKTGQVHQHSTKGENMLRKRTDPVLRFWLKVDIRSDDECWIWNGPVSNCGYGNFSVGGKRSPDYKQWSAHRYAWVIANGEIPDGLNVCHTCDNRLCVNPAHLFLGTDVDNMADKVAKDRQAKGSTSGKSKLSEADVNKVIELYNSGKLQREVGEELGVSQAVVSKILLGQNWKHVDVNRPRTRTAGAKLTWSTVDFIRFSAGLGATVSTLATRHNVSRITIRRILAGTTWQEANRG
jgi:hypothetical protein